jgi:cytochrome c-type biogenesis protein CcmH
MTRQRPDAARDDEHDLEVYRDQLGEIDREREAGLIEPREAEEARAEVGRRILRVDALRRDRAAPRGFGRKAGLAGMAAVLSVPLVSWGLYAAIGSPGLPAQPLQVRLQQNPADSSIAELVARAEAHLASNPTDARGWDVLAPVYLRIGRHGDAVSAYRRAIQLDQPTPARETGLGEALAANAGGLVTVEAQAAFERALEIDPTYARARFLLATGYAQEDRMDDARAIWTAMRAELPADSPWQPLLVEALGEPPVADAPGPTQAEVEAAGAMGEAERTQMVETMVAGLDQRLRDNPNDGEGWQRLIRSYLVLGRQDEARAALDRGLAALGRDSAIGSELLALAEALGIEPASEQAN